MIETAVPQNNERRRFFRIEDEINLFFKKIDPAIVDKSIPATGDEFNSCSLVVDLDVLNQEATLILSRIERSNRDLADYLKVLDKKIALLATAVLRDANNLDDLSSRNASLSASGVSFECEEMLNTGDFLELRMLLSSCMAVFICYGKVIYCRKNKLPNSPYPYVAGVEYVEIKEQDKELMIKHVVKRQMQQIRKLKES